MFIPNDEHYNFLESCIDEKPEHIIISTFGIYAGLTFDGRDSTEWGDGYSLRTRDLLEKMRELDNVRILVGLAQYNSCKGKIPCLHCEKQYVKTMFRTIFHVEKFPEFEWRMTDELHLKCALFFYDQDCTPSLAKGVSGGRNFTNSSWPDVTFELDESQIGQLHDYTSELWDSALTINDANASIIIQQQNISPKGIQSIADKLDR